MTANSHNSEVLFSCMAKATLAEGSNLRHSFNWVVSRRGILKVSRNALEFGDWRIPYDTIEEAILFSFRQMLIPGFVLRVKAGSTIYQFGLNGSRFWFGELPFPVLRETARVKYSWFSIIVRIFAIGMVAYLVIRRFL